MRGMFSGLGAFGIVVIAREQDGQFWRQVDNLLYPPDMGLWRK